MLTDAELREIRAEWAVFNSPDDVAAQQVHRLLDEIERLRAALVDVASSCDMCADPGLLAAVARRALSEH